MLEYTARVTRHAGDCRQRYGLAYPTGGGRVCDTVGVFGRAAHLLAFALSHT